MNNRGIPETVERIDELVQEVMNGEPKRDHLINSANEFSRQVQADYFSNSRQFIQNMVCDVVFNRSQNILDAMLLKKIKGDQ